MKDFIEILKSIFALFLLTCIVAILLPFAIRLFIVIYQLLEKNIL